MYFIAHILCTREYAEFCCILQKYGKAGGGKGKEVKDSFVHHKVQALPESIRSTRLKVLAQFQISNGKKQSELMAELVDALKKGETAGVSSSAGSSSGKGAQQRRSRSPRRRSAADKTGSKEYAG